MSFKLSGGGGKGSVANRLKMNSIGSLGLNPFNLKLHDRVQKCLVTSLVVMFLVTISCDYCVGSSGGNNGRGGGPEFADLLKNSTVNEGSHVDFSCNVRHLSGNRIMWLKKEDDKEVLLGINTLKITKNPQITFSIIPSSDEVTTSILYINNVEKSDEGTYHCIVNSSPLILQVGTLEVKEVVHAPTPPPTISPIVERTIKPTATVITTSVPVTNTNSNKAHVPNETETVKVTGTSSGTGTGTGTTVSSGSESESGPSPSSKKCDPVSCEDWSSRNPDSNIFCVDVDKIWNQTRDGAQYLFSWVFTCLQTIF